MADGYEDLWILMGCHGGFKFEGRGNGGSSLWWAEKWPLLAGRSYRWQSSFRKVKSGVSG